MRCAVVDFPQLLETQGPVWGSATFARYVGAERTHVRCGFTALQREVTGADQMAHRDGVSNPGKDTYGNAASFLKRTRLSVYRTAVTPSG